MLKKSDLLAGVRLTDNERRLGRLLRDGEGHPAPAPTPSPSPAPAPAPAPGEQDFADFEDSLDDAGDDDDDNSSGDDVDPATPGADDDDGTPPPEGDDRQGASVQERIDELTAKQRQAERDLEAERRETARLREELEQRGKKPDDQQKKERSPDERPNPDDYEFGEADGKYIEDLAVWRADQRINEREQQRAFQAQIDEVEKNWTNAVGSDDVKAKYADFDEKVTKGADRGDWDLSPIGVAIVKSSPVGPDVAYHLASNAAESKRIAQLSPVEQALEIGRLEGRFMNSGGKQPAKVASDAPPPPENRSRGAGGKFQTAPDTEDFASFDKFADGVLGTKQ